MFCCIRDTTGGSVKLASYRMHTDLRAMDATNGVGGPPSVYTGDPFSGWHIMAGTCKTCAGHGRPLPLTRHQVQS